MFTGIIQALSTVKAIETKGSGKSICFDYPPCLNTSQIGDSISVNGVCSTIVSLKEGHFVCDYLYESLKKSNLDELCEEETVNVELALKASSPMGGHVVSGHIDTKLPIKTLSREAPWGRLELEIPKEDLNFVVYKGSICIDGISLTIASLEDQTLGIELIPHTLEETTLNKKKQGSYVNIEYDMLGKYVINYLTNQKGD